VSAMKRKESEDDGEAFSRIQNIKLVR